MNSELLHQIADQIEDEPELYDQLVYDYPRQCGTAHCVAGWAVAIAVPELLDGSGRTAWGRLDPWRLGIALLDITPGEADLLFDGHSGPRLGHTPSEALHKMAEAGEVDSDVWGPPT